MRAARAAAMMSMTLMATMVALSGMPSIVSTKLLQNSSEQHWRHVSVPPSVLWQVSPMEMSPVQDSTGGRQPAITSPPLKDAKQKPVGQLTTEAELVVRFVASGAAGMMH